MSRSQFTLAGFTTMTNDATAPRNALEALLLEMHAGRLDPYDFARQLMAQQVFMPVQDEKHRIAGFQSSIRAQPLVAEDADGNRVLVLFSDPERSRGFLAGYPGYGGGILERFSWVLRRMSAGTGIALNPGHELGFDFDPEMVAMLAGVIPDEEQ